MATSQTRKGRQAAGLSLLFILPCVFAAPQQYSASPGIIERHSAKDFASVAQDAEFVITEYNFRIVNTLRISDAIRERGNTSFPRHEIILFCNLSIAETMLLLASDFIYHCPYRLNISETDVGIRVGINRLPEPPEPTELHALSQKINALLEKIVAYAAADDPFLLDEQASMAHPAPAE